MLKKQFVIVLAVLTVIVFAGSGVRADIMVPAGTNLTVAFDQDVSSKYVKPGDLIPIRLMAPVSIGGLEIVKSGCKGSARVKSVKPAGKGGSPGSVEVELLELEPNGSYATSDGTKVQLIRAEGTIKAEGKGKKTLSYLFILGLFIKGGQGVIPADQPIDAQVAQDIFIVIN